MTLNYLISVLRKHSVRLSIATENILVFNMDGFVGNVIKYLLFATNFLIMVSFYRKGFYI